MYTPYQLAYALRELEHQESVLREVLVKVKDYENLTAGEYMQIDHIRHNARRAMVRVLEIKAAMELAKEREIRDQRTLI